MKPPGLASGRRLGEDAGMSLRVGIVATLTALLFACGGGGGAYKVGSPQSDKDGDGISDHEDRCTADAEDKDGYRDWDGCPDWDNDNDRIADGDDKCPNDRARGSSDGCDENGSADMPAPESESESDYESESEDESESEADRDSDGIVDADDACPDQFGTGNGCPVTDRDGDGVPDDSDKCVNKAGSTRHSGCPDNDGDGIYDDVDLCVDAKEVVNGYKDSDGCPD